MHRTRRAPGRRTLASIAIGALLASGAGALVAAPASAAPVETTGGSLTWGIDADYSAMWPSANSRGVTAPAQFVSGDVAAFPHSTGSYDDESGEGTLSFSGAVRYGYFAGPPFPGSSGNYVYLSNPSIVIDGDSAVLSGTTAGSSHEQNADLPTTQPAIRTFANLDLGAVEPTVTDSTITWTAVPTTITDQGAVVFADYSTGAATKRAAGSALDPITITVDRELPEVEQPAPAVATTTAVAASPASPVALGQQTTVTATVAAAGGATPTGDVLFTATPAAGPAVSLGTGVLSAGKATWTGSLPAGGYHLSAAYQGVTGVEASFSPSSAQLMAPASRPGGTPSVANYSVVDVAQPVSYMVDEAVTTATGVSAQWAYSAYSAAWAKTATGDIGVDGQSFSLSDGIAVADAGGVVVDFSGTIRVAAYTGIAPYAPAGAWVELVDPSLAIAADGTGTWTAGVRKGETVDNDAPPVRTVVSSFRGASLPDLTADGSTSIVFDYADTTTIGTWSRAHDDAWSNAFIMQVPASIRAFYYATGANADATKPASPLALAWGAVVITEPEVPVEPEIPVEPQPEEPVLSEDGNLAWGFLESWRDYVTGIARGTISTADGATQVDDGRFVFPQAEGSDADTTTGIGTIRYEGSVTFASALHRFSYTFADPWIVTAADGTRVLTALSSTDVAPTSTELRRVTLAELAPVESLAPVARFTALAAAPGLSFDNIAATFTGALPEGLAQYRDRAADAVSYGYEVAVVDPGTTAPGAATPPGVTSPGATSPAAVGTTRPVAESCTARAVSGASISWNVKESFRSYIQGSIANGSYSINWGGGNGAFNTEDDRGRVAYSGSASFSGHSGALDMNLSNPRIQVTSATSASLILDVRSAGYGSNAGVSASGVVFATLRLPAVAETADRISWSGASATLTAAGAEAFSGFYSAGETLDPVSFSFPLGAEVECDATTSTTLASTGSEQGAQTLWIGLGLLLLGAGVFALRRRTAGV